MFNVFSLNSEIELTDYISDTPVDYRSPHSITRFQSEQNLPLISVETLEENRGEFLRIGKEL